MLPQIPKVPRNLSRPKILNQSMKHNKAHIVHLTSKTGHFRTLKNHSLVQKSRNFNTILFHIIFMFKYYIQEECYNITFRFGKELKSFQYFFEMPTKSNHNV